MKKTYIAPSVEVIKVDVANVMAISMVINEATTVDTSDGEQLSRDFYSPFSSNIYSGEW